MSDAFGPTYQPAIYAASAQRQQLPVPLSVARGGIPGAPARQWEGYLGPILRRIFEVGLCYYPLNNCRVTIASGPTHLMPIDPRNLIMAANVVVTGNSVKEVLFETVAAVPSAALTTTQTVFGWIITLSDSILNWRAGPVLVRLTYSTFVRDVWVTPTQQAVPRSSFIAIAVNDNQGLGNLAGAPAGSTLIVQNGSVNPTTFSFSAESLNMRDLGRIG